MDESLMARLEYLASLNLHIVIHGHDLRTVLADVIEEIDCLDSSWKAAENDFRY